MNDYAALTESTYYILLSLCDSRHGYGIMQCVEELSDGRVRLAPGTLYGALTTMCDKGWILQLPVEDGSRKKEYKLTDRGRRILENELRRLEELTENGRRVLREERV